MARETLPSLTRRSALADRTALVTGASGAFGSATLQVLRYLGARVIGIDRKPGDGVLACDVTDDDQVATVIGEATGQLGGRLDALIHYAGIGPAVDAGRPPGAGTREALDVNLLGTWRVTAAAMPAAAADRAPRDVASTSPGTAALRAARHAPGLVNRAVAARAARLARSGTFAGAALAAGLRERHTGHPRAGTTPETRTAKEHRP